MFQHILVPLGGSFRAEQALPVAARLARATGGSLLLVRVVNQPIDYIGGLSPVPLMTEQTVESEPWRPQIEARCTWRRSSKPFNRQRRRASSAS